MIPPFRATKIETLAPIATIMVPTGPKIAVPASITGVSLPASCANPTVPTQTTEISILTAITIIIPIIIALGSVFLGSLMSALIYASW